MKSVFVCGATGYIGSRLIPLLAARKHHVKALVREGSERKLPDCCEAVTGNALDSASFEDRISPGDTFVQLVGVAKPGPGKGAQFRVVDRVAGLESIRAAAARGAGHFIYLSVAHPAPVMGEYIAVRLECENSLRASGLPATVLRPWYVLGPGHWWPLVLLPFYKAAGLLPATRDAADRLGLVWLEEMLGALVRAVEEPPEGGTRILHVPDIRAWGRGPEL